MTAVPDFLEKSVLLQATRARTWRALSAADLGSWFGVAIGTEPFAPGVRVQGRGTDPGYEDFVFDILIDRVEPERSLAWRWHPAVMDPAGDYSSEPMTLVVFELEALNEGTRLRIVESGFDHSGAATDAGFPHEQHRLGRCHEESRSLPRPSRRLSPPTANAANT